MNMAKKRGRKPGSPNHDRIQNVVKPSRCEKCGSTERDAYRKIIREQRINQTIDGESYNWIQWKPTRCSDCGQHRTDRIYQFKPELEK